MTLIEQIMKLQTYKMYEDEDTVYVERKDILKLLEQQPCEDCISRESIIEWLKDKDIIKTKNQEENARRELAELPSVTPQRERGKWIEVEICNCHAALRCSICYRVIEPTFTFGEYSYESIKKWYPFCHCGADMRGDTDDNMDASNNG